MKLRLHRSFFAITFALLVFAFSFFSFDHVRAADVKVVLTGNTADLKDPDQLFEIIREHTRNNPDTVIWVLNGDVFPESYTDEQILTWKSKANGLLDSNAKLFILLNQGDRDWMDSGEGGWKKIRSLEKLLSQAGHPRFQVFLNQGCPGPWTVSFPNLEVVVINSQWWNHPFEKPLPTSDACTIADTDNFIEELEGILDETKTKNVLVLSHLPLVSSGNYGGRFPVSAYLLPPKVAFRQHVGTSKDIVNQAFDPFRYRLANVLRDYTSIVFASGHEFNHSISKAENNFYVNSGALASSGFVAKSKRALLASSDPGVIELTYSRDGQVSFTSLKLNGNTLSASMAGALLNATTETFAGAGNVKPQVPDQSSIKVAAGPEYASSWFKRLWFGQHYRFSWTTPVQVPYLNFDTTSQGLLITGKGGGRQTTSLKLSAGNGKEYVFRSVNKDPYRALGFELRGTVVADVLKDQTSTQQPYGAMAVAPLMDKIGVLHATPKLFVLPDDPRLGDFQAGYAGLFGMLEERPNDKIEKDKVFGGAKDIEKSFKMFAKLYHDHDNYINKEEFGRARMFDLWIGDWSKHEDNWKWAGFKDKRGEVFRPIPRDRDHAFSRWDGIIPWIADREWGVPNGENFDKKIHGLRSLMWQARHLDRFAGSELTQADWVNAARQIQQSITETDIENAVRNMPAEIYQRDGKEIERKLKVRIKDLETYAGQYYALLAKEVDVVGSNKKEFFKVTRHPDGSVEVTVSGIADNRKPDLTKIFYHRKFFADETKEIRLFGLQDDDIFEVKGNAEKSILVRIISGGGDDVISDQSVVSGKKKMTLLYDKSASTELEAGPELKNVRPKNAGLYEYNRNAFKYNTYLPVALFTYSPFIGVAFHAGVTFTKQSFSKPDFSAKHAFRASVSMKGNYDFNYNNQFRQLVGNWDGISGIGISRPLNYNYFFGVGNDTENDPGRSSNYYRAQYNSISAFAGLTRTFWKKSIAEVTSHYEMNEGIQRNDSYLGDHPEIFGVEKLNLFSIKGTFKLDFRDRVALPERGFLFAVTQQAGHISKSNNALFSISEVEIEQYLSTYLKNPLTLGLRLGGGFSEGDIPFYKKLSLGQLDGLRGYKRNRFTGRARAFINTELRYQLVQTRNTFVPLKIGVRGFYDIGQVWSAGEKDAAKYWHKGYGGGFYITPFREQFAFNISAGSSREEPLLLTVSVGSFF
ncbi:outer membrane protein assembly factor [Dyadobacter sp. LJ53]|uniref:outer membrane protein assembly factor n=1 Tax=Dyadobacter chenwenxiniae TaxID=2906456 RepID=UPI001F4748D5|nr:outer membrane protein assembly factor [Dyadobacter chenwenxiniae]MCF0049062.1 outer membrane protein assembly factor [Dyadobacter chenwenxiniae]